MDDPTFRADFPEFASTSAYPAGTVAFYLGIAGAMLNADRWGALLDYGTALFIAHHLALSARDQNTVAAGGVPGTVSGPLASKSVDKVASSYDTGAVSLTDGGFWNLTSYGIRFLQTARLIGAGGIQL